MNLKWPECSVCLEPFDRVSHIPKSLCCGHSICLFCLHELKKKYDLHCPQCRAYFLLGRVRTNFEMLTTLETLEQSAEGGRRHAEQQREEGFASGHASRTLASFPTPDIKDALEAKLHRAGLSIGILPYRGAGGDDEASKAPAPAPVPVAASTDMASDASLSPTGGGFGLREVVVFVLLSVVTAMPLLWCALAVAVVAALCSPLLLLMLCCGMLVR